MNKEQVKKLEEDILTMRYVIDPETDGEPLIKTVVRIKNESWNRALEEAVFLIQKHLSK